MTTNDSQFLTDNPLGDWISGLLGLVPDDYAAYRPLVRDALLFFLERLPADHLETILAEQLKLPIAATPAHRLHALFLACPTLHKLGQVVARDRRLTPALRLQLQRLESRRPEPLPTELRTQLARLRQRHPQLQPARVALAEGSVAIVVPFELADEHAGIPHGVFKLLRPGVIEQLDIELPIWSDLGEYLAQRCLVHELPEFDYRNTLETVARLLRHEVDFLGEQAHLQAAAELYRSMPEVRIPRLLPFCTADVTAMERINGCKVTDLGDESPPLRQRFGTRILRALVATPFWQRSRDTALFHADPHAGNLLATDDGRLAILDWALVAKLPKRSCEELIGIVLAALRRDRAALCMGIERLGHILDPDRLAECIDAHLSNIGRGALPGFRWLLALFDALAARSLVRFDGQLLLFRKAMLTLDGVVADLTDTPPFDSVLISSGLSELLTTLPWRWCMPDPWRTGPAHLANADLFKLWLSAPATCLRLWR